MLMREQHLGKEIDGLREEVVRGEQRALTLGLRSNVKITICIAEVLFPRGRRELSDRRRSGNARWNCRVRRGKPGKIGAIDRIHVARRTAGTRKRCYCRCRKV